MRTFDGAKLFWRGGDWNIDSFWVRPVAFGILTQSQRQSNQLDVAQDFYGVWSTYHGKEQHTFDLCLVSRICG